MWAFDFRSEITPESKSSLFHPLLASIVDLRDLWREQRVVVAFLREVVVQRRDRGQAQTLSLGRALILLCGASRPDNRDS
jgi:hypothetical protein